MSNPTNTRKSYSELMRSYSDILESELTESKKDDDKEDKKEDKVEDKKEDKKPSNVKESAADFFIRVSDVLKESNDEDEDEDVKKADSVKGKDGSTQADSEKKLPPWLAKKDKEDEDKGAKKAKKDKDI